jgi:hypothetical protein
MTHFLEGFMAAKVKAGARAEKLVERIVVVVDIISTTIIGTGLLTNMAVIAEVRSSKDLN